MAGTVAWIAWRYLRCPRGPVPVRAWVGLPIILGAEVSLFLRASGWVSVYFTPIVWTGYILLADGLVASLKGESRLSRAPGQFAALALWSVPLWLIFEAYNLRLQNWRYEGLPEVAGLDHLGFIWSFATIWPAIFETADLLEALGLSRAPGRPTAPFAPAVRWMIAAAGLVMVTAPVLIPVRIGSYLFGAVWIGFALLLDPVVYHWRGPSLLRDLEAGNRTRLFCLLGAGWVCGILWEFWNYWAGARWVYVFPMAQQWKIFEMPLPGFGGFPAFAVECWLMYQTLRILRRQLHTFRKQPTLVRTEV